MNPKCDYCGIRDATIWYNDLSLEEYKICNVCRINYAAVKVKPKKDLYVVCSKCQTVENPNELYPYQGKDLCWNCYHKVKANNAKLAAEADKLKIEKKSNYITELECHRCHQKEYYTKLWHQYGHNYCRVCLMSLQAELTTPVIPMTVDLKPTEWPALDSSTTEDSIEKPKRKILIDQL